MSDLLMVWLDDSSNPSGPGTVIGHPRTVREFLDNTTDRDGARDPRYRLWRGRASIGARVYLESEHGPTRIE